MLIYWEPRSHCATFRRSATYVSFWLLTAVVVSGAEGCGKKSFSVVIDYTRKGTCQAPRVQALSRFLQTYFVYLARGQ